MLSRRISSKVMLSLLLGQERRDASPGLCPREFQSWGERA